MSAPLLCLLFSLVVVGYCSEMLNGVPITFELAGDVTYTPTSGGVNIPGYKLRVGFSRYKWIGIKFMTVTSQSTFDVFIVSRDTNPVGGYYEASVAEYFVSQGRQDKLISDSINNMDKEVTSFSDSNYFEIEVARTKGDTQGEDWEGGEFVSVCFYTNDQQFDQDVWTGLYSTCYGYDVTEDFHSTFRGRSLTSMKMDGVSGLTYGGIDGPVLELKLFWFANVSVLSSSDVYIRIGSGLAEERLGYDYQKCGDGDYFGTSTSSLTRDTTWSGYDDGACTVTSSASSTKIQFSRLVDTDDQFDSLIYSSTQICLIVGTRSSCANLQFSTIFPIMTVDSAFIIFESALVWTLGLATSLILLQII